MLRHLIWNIEHDKFERKNYDNRSNTLELTRTIISIWEAASIPCLSSSGVSKYVDKIHNEYKQFQRICKKQKEPCFDTPKINKFREQCNSLFDVAACKCILDIKYAYCSCKSERRVPVAEMDFLADQRSERKMYIGRIEHVQPNAT